MLAIAVYVPSVVTVTATFIYLKLSSGLNETKSLPSALKVKEAALTWVCELVFVALVINLE